MSFRIAPALALTRKEPLLVQEDEKRVADLRLGTKRLGRGAAAAVLAVFLVLAGGCASVPRQSVDLSYTLGQDIEALHQSHRDLIKRYFEALRTQVNDAIDRVYISAYINSFVVSGRLVQHAQNQRADLVEHWARLAVRTIDRERTARLQPLYDAERELLASMDDAFGRAVRANAAITAHLSSVVKTQQAQDDLLASMRLGDLRQEIHHALAAASEKASRITEEIGSATDKLENRNTR